jgi:hypothetical protein
MAHEVFVSYSQPDQECATELVTRLEQEGLSCWIAPRDIAPSTDWAAEIIDAITNARVMVLIFSSSSNASPQVRREVERAAHKQVSILPFRIENVLPSKSLEYFLSAQHWLDAFATPREPYYAKLAAYLKTHANDAPAPLDTTSTQPALRLVESTHLDPAELARVERLLAGYIGPIARHLVKAAAARAATMEQLIQQVAVELETETERHEFTRRWRTGG